MLQMEKFLFSSGLNWCLTFSPFLAPAFGNSRCTSYVVEPPFARGTQRLFSVKYLFGEEYIA